MLELAAMAVVIQYLFLPHQARHLWQVDTEQSQHLKGWYCLHQPVLCFSHL